MTDFFIPRPSMPEQIVSALKDCRSVAITTHTRPDGDGIGSQLALGLFLEKKGIRTALINHDHAPYSLDWMPYLSKIQLFDGSIDQREAIARADALVVLDTNSENRLGDVGPSFRAAEGRKLLIDHHTGAEDWFDLALIRETSSSTGELVFELIDAWDVDAVGPDIATALYVAIMTDTGSFRFSNVTGRLHRIVGELIERGDLDTATIHAEIFDRRSPEGIRLFSRVLSTLELYYEGQIGSMVISRRALNETGANIEEAEGFVNHILSVDGVRVAILFTETERGTKVSFRSKGNNPVHQWARALGGGGHRNASGAFVRHALEETMKDVVERAPKYIDLDPGADDEATRLDPEDQAYLSSLIDGKSQNPAP